MTPDSVMTKQTHFPYSSINPFHQAGAASILNLFQDMASEHAMALEVSGFDLAKKNLKWVVTRYHMHIKEPIAWMRPFRVHTWRTPCKNLYEMRQFSITDLDDTPLVTATGVWVMVNKTTGRPVRLNRFFSRPMLDCDPDFRIDLPDIRLPCTPDHEKEFTAYHRDIDLNNHVNHTVYLGWALESVPADIFQCFFPEKIDMGFQNETLQGQTAVAMTQVIKTRTQVMSLHEIIEKNRRTPLSKVNISWKPNNH